jgi:secreted trypsin-like serine protease
MNDSKFDAIKLSLLTAALTAVGGCTAETTDGATEHAETTSSAIVGGQATSAYPAVGALTRYGSPFCTGTVVAKRVVVTAAHCLAGKSGSDMGFALGSNGFAPQVELGVSHVIPHPSFDPQRVKNDIGVVVLSEDAPVTPVAINGPMASSWVGRSLTFVGFGATNGYGSGSGTKRAVEIPVSQVASTQFAYEDTSKNTCFGDSGGPAFATDEGGKLLLAGVTSFGDRTCSQYGVDTRVDAYTSFIAAAEN